jgi:DNA-binding NarL/FixJ family response regulator
MNGAPLSVLVADTNEVLRREVRRELERAGFEVIEAADSDEAIDLALEACPTLCLLDVEEPCRSGLAAATVIACVLDGTSVVLMSSDLSAGDVLDAMRAGAAGCVDKAINARLLPGILSAVAAGEAAYPQRELRQALGLLTPQVA